MEGALRFFFNFLVARANEMTYVIRFDSIRVVFWIEEVK